MKIRYWALVGVLYVAVVIGSYTAITGANPLESTDMHEDHGNAEEAQESYEVSSVQNEEDGQMDHHHQQTDGASDVHTDVSYNGGEVRVQLEDVHGTVPELEETHEKEMHLIIVSNDLEDFIHLHPEREEDAIHTAPTDLENGHYQAFVDMAPKDRNYVVQPNDLQVGEGKQASPSASLSASENLTQEINGKTVTLETEGLSTSDTTKLDFDLHGEEPEPYLGALGHVVILDEDAETFIHVHPTSDHTTTFETHIDQPGLYKVWAEFQYEDTGVLTFPFVLQVDE
ncbi:hypothetical protein EPH95_01780 [Salicibibacter halophilus]|uniref:Secreted protein n=1 Tax=Salicibibacter halophilus TaxID=2502791 RepID=A0A514LDY6_9BACI|nr:hypothetical protein [Salicibibacter halophilus]QDI90059.1 hypothetical protein EPH95_01780 [Salicibibacter halophilus]